MIIDIATIGGRLRQARLTKNLSQIELAKKMGVRQGTISRAESGHDLRVGTLLEIARALDLDVVLAPRRLRPLIDHLIDGGAPGHTSVYTGAGDEPYSESETTPNEAPERGLLAGLSPYNLPRYLSTSRDRAERGSRHDSSADDESGPKS